MIERIGQQLQGFTLMVLLPLFFTGVAAQHVHRTLGSDVGRWLLFLAVLAVALLTKVVGTWAAARGGRLAAARGAAARCADELSAV